MYKLALINDGDLYFRASLGSATSSGQALGQPDLSQSILADLDGQVLADFMQEIGAEMDYDVERYFVDCGRAASLPNLTVTVADFELSFSYKDYVDLVSFNNEMLDIHSAKYRQVTTMASASFF